jgi:hypothetical protein
MAKQKKIFKVIAVKNNGTEILCKDGLREQVEMLGQLSKTLDEYFILRSVSRDWTDNR